MTFINLNKFDNKTWEKIHQGFNYLGYGMPDVNAIKDYVMTQKVLNQDQQEIIENIVYDKRPEPLYTLSQIIRDNELSEEHFGLTDNFSFAGYILTNGNMLNFSEDGCIRTLDHREIDDIIDNSNPVDSMIQFINYGNIRVGFRGFELSKPPTPEQKSTLSRFIMYLNKKEGECYVDIANTEGKVINSLRFPRMHPKAIINEIESYFEQIKDFLPGEPEEELEREV